MKCRIKSKSKTIFIVEIDNKIRGILPEKILRFFSLQLGKERDLNQAEIHKLDVEIEKFAREKILNFLSYRERSAAECENYLRHLPLDDEFVQKLLKQAKENNFINDERFAEMYVENLLEKGKNRREVQNKLFEKHIEKSIIDNVLNKYFSLEKKEEILERNVQKALKRFSRFPQKERIEKCLNYLTRRGFSYYEVREKLEKEI